MGQDDVILQECKNPWLFQQYLISTYISRLDSTEEKVQKSITWSRDERKSKNVNFPLNIYVSPVINQTFGSESICHWCIS